MANHPNRSVAQSFRTKAARVRATEDRRTARAAGYYVIDHRPVGWRIGLEGYPTFEDSTNRFDTASEAWAEAARMARERAISDANLALED